MRTQTKTRLSGNSQFTARELPALAILIPQWSSLGFQNFYEFGAFDDMVDAAKKGQSGTISISLRQMVKQSNKPGDMTKGQMRMVIEKIPDGCWEKFYLAFAEWTLTAGWWDEPDKPIRWQIRDEWREEMGLERINRIYPIGDTGQEVIFRKTIQAAGSEVEGGYRLATLSELEKVGAEIVMNMPDRRTVMIKEDLIWRLVRKDAKSFYTIPAGNLYDVATVYYPLVKL